MFAIDLPKFSSAAKHTGYNISAIKTDVTKKLNETNKSNYYYYKFTINLF